PCPPPEGEGDLPRKGGRNWPQGGGERPVAPEMAVNRLAQEWREPAPSPIEVSIVMPCLNEAATRASCIRKAQMAIAKDGLAAEIIVADNGSTDGSATIARALGARLVSAEQRGYGAALQAGIAAARGQYVVIGDADDSYDFSAIGPF